MTELQLVDGIYEADVPWRGMIREIQGLVASNFPVKPPSGWFTDPSLDRLTPLTIDQSGRVYGHIAAWHTSHIGMAGGVKPPKSKSNYAFFRTGQVETSDNVLVDVGQITLAGGHAPLDVNAARAVAHYDDTSSAIMDVSAGEDQHGIWVAGALRPSVSDEQVRAMRASSVSGDWRPINGRLELVAVCAVNCPGFPIPRTRVASGSPIALVAAGIEPLVDIAIADHVEEDVEAGIEAGLNLFRKRIKQLEDAFAVTNPGAVAEPVAAGAPVPGDTADELRKRVKPGYVAAGEPTVSAAELRARVQAPMAASLRARVRSADAVPFA